MATTDLIAAIELSSTKIVGIVGQKMEDGSINVLAYAPEDARQFIGKGSIFNIDKAANALESVIKQLEAQLNSTIVKVYVGIGGKGMKAVGNDINREIIGQDKVSQRLIDDLDEENRNYPIDRMKILDVEPQECDVEGKLVDDPVGVTGQHITAHYLNILVREDMHTNLLSSLKQANIEYADIFTTSRALSGSVLTENELKGCALVDMGAETTTVSIFRNKRLRYLMVIPLGGHAITRDLTSLHIDEDEAEQIKLAFGNVNPDLAESEEEEGKTITLQDGRTVPASQLREIIEARMNEIIANVWNLIKRSGCEDKLLQGIIITGGAAAMPGVVEAFKNHSHIEKIRLALSTQLTIQGFNSKLNVGGTSGTLLGILALGNENCCKPKEKPAEPTPAPIGDGLFDNDPVLKEQEEEAKRAKAKREADERKQKEKEQKKREREEKKNKTTSWFKDTFGKLTTELFSEEAGDDIK